MKKYSFKIVVLALLASMFSLTGQGCLGGGATGERVGPATPVTLNYWTVFNNPNDYAPLIQAYRALYPHITINVQTFRPEEFDSLLLEALAEDRGPDIFSIPNNAVRKNQAKLLPMPAATTIEQSYIKGSLKKETFTAPKTFPSYTPRYLKDTFVDQVYEDVNIENQVWGLPLSMDVLALYYNKNLLNAAGIATPAANYQELQEQVVKLTRQDRLGNVLQSGVAMGATNNIPRFADIVSLLMMQNGTRMTSDEGTPTFNLLPLELAGRESMPAADALTFYTDFASPLKQVYSWNNTQPNALQAFEDGKLAYFFGYAYHMPIIRGQAPKLNFGVTKVPQIPGNAEVNVASYWLESVSKKSKHPNESWNFLQFIAKPENISNYLTLAKRPAAVRSLLPAQFDDLEIGPFAEEVLTARSWYKGRKPEALDAIFAEMVTLAADGTVEIKGVLNNAAEKVNQTYQ